jgi:hypothetical protein
MPVSNLSPYQLALQSVVGTGKGAGANLTPDILGRVADQVFGPFPIPPGSQIVFQGPDRAEWIDPEGYRHSATRSLDGRDPNAGRIQDNTNRPPILPAGQGQQDLLGQLTGAQGIKSDIEAVRNLAARLQEPAVLAQLDPATKAALDLMTQNTLAQLTEQFKRDQGANVAQLFGNRVQSSSIATDALSRLLESQGRVTSGALAEGAARELGARQFITDTQRANLATALQGLLGGADLQSGLIQNLTGQQTQRDIAGGNLNLGFADLAERARTSNLDFQLGQQEADRRLAESRALLPKILGTIQALGQGASGVGTALGAYNAFNTARRA